MNALPIASCLLLLLGCASTPAEPPAEPPAAVAARPKKPVRLVPLEPAEPLPRVLVTASHGEEFLVIQIEEAFQQAGFETIDGLQLASIKEVDAALHARDDAKLSVLLGRPGAELLVICQPEPGGYSARVVCTDTLLRLTSGLAAGPDAVAKLGQQLAAQSLEQWRKPRDRRIWVQVFVSQVDALIASELVERISAQPGVADCCAFRLRQQTSELEVGYEGAMPELVALLMDVPGLKIVGFEARRIEAEWQGR